MISPSKVLPHVPPACVSACTLRPPPRPHTPPQGVNTTLYDPALHTSLNLRDRAELVFGKHWEAKLADRATAALNTPTMAYTAPAARSGDSSSGSRQLHSTASATASSSGLGGRGVRGNSGSGGSRVSGGSSNGGGVPRRPFRFISTFKWEARKGWDILLEAYLTAFTPEDDVE
jgi:hypothetical protein